MKYPEPVVVQNDGSRYATRIKAGHHILISDEPAAEGGTDQGPTAHQLLLSALGACTAITLRMYADRKGWDLQRVSVDLNMDGSDNTSGPETKIYLKLSLEGQLDTAQRERLAAIAKKCPVHKTLTGAITIETSL